MPKQLYRKLKSYTILIRPIGWGPFFFAILFGAIDANIDDISTLYLLLLIYGPLLLGGLYTFNFYTDRRLDQLSDVKKDIEMKTQPFVTGEVGKYEGLILGSTLVCTGLVLAYHISIIVFFLSFINVLLGLIYSFPPRLKEVPFADVFVNSSAAALSYLAGWAAFKPLASVDLLPAFWIFFGIMATYLLTVLVDIEADKLTGARTTGTFLGVDNAITLSAIAFALSFILYLATLLKSPNLAYIIILPAALKGIHSYYELRRQRVQGKIYSLGRKAVISSSLGFLILLVMYTAFAVCNIEDKSVLSWIIGFISL